MAAAAAAEEPEGLLPMLTQQSCMKLWGYVNSALPRKCRLFPLAYVYICISLSNAFACYPFPVD